MIPPSDQVAVSSARQDGRSPWDLQDIAIEIEPLQAANGSSRITWGTTQVISGVYGPREVHPRHLRDPLKAIIQCKFGLAPFSTENRKRPGPDKRCTEISRMIGDTVERMIFLNRYPKTSIDIYIETLQSGSALREASLLAASIALVDAGIPMRGLITAVSLARVNGHPVLDPSDAEVQEMDGNILVAMPGGDDALLMLDVDGAFGDNEIEEGMDMLEEGCSQIYALQRKALKEYFDTDRIVEE